MRLLGPHGRDPAGARNQVRGGRHPPGSDGSARSCRRSRTGRRSRSCSSTASWSAAATSSPRCTRPASSQQTLGLEGRAGRRGPEWSPGRGAAAVDREPALANTAAIARAVRARAGHRVRFADGALWALDQTLLPWREVELELRDADGRRGGDQAPLDPRRAADRGGGRLRSRARARARPRRARARLPDPDRRPADGGQPRLRRRARARRGAARRRRRRGALAEARAIHARGGGRQRRARGLRRRRAGSQAGGS